MVPFCSPSIRVLQLKRLEDSVKDCSSALELDENYFKAVMRRAKSYMDLEKYEEAVRDYETAHRMERCNHEARQMLQQAKIKLKQSKRKDYYKILGVERGANDDEIKKAYRKRALVHHPGNYLDGLFSLYFFHSFFFLSLSLLLCTQHLSLYRSSLVRI